MTRLSLTALSSTKLPMLTLLLALAGCTAIENFAGGDKVDYRTSGTKTPGLDIPPDLSQLARDSRYQSQGGSVSAAALQAGATAAVAPSGAASGAISAGPFVRSAGDLRIERLGNQRWLSTPLTQEQLWPQLQAFWKDSGFALVVDDAAVGVMETNWNENRAKLSTDIVRTTIGKVFDNLFSTGELDKFRTRVERAAGGTEVYISHRGQEEVSRGVLKDNIAWEARPADTELEAIFLARLMVKLGVKAEQAKAAVGAASAPVPARARVLENRPAAALQMDDGFDRAWRRVGLALDRRGFTVEDRDRAQGLYFVRYVDPAFAGKDEPGFLAKLFSDSTVKTGPQRYRVVVKGDGPSSTITVLNAKGEPENGEAGKRIVALLVEDLK